MRAFWLKAGSLIIPEALEIEGIGYKFIAVPDPSGYDALAARLLTETGYSHHDYSKITPETPDEVLSRFDREHIHEDDEVRYVLEGSGIFDIRPSGNTQEDWMRVHVEPGDYLAVPKGRNHRFFAPDKDICVLRLFRTDPKWTPIYV